MSRHRWFAAAAVVLLALVTGLVVVAVWPHSDHRATTAPIASLPPHYADPPPTVGVFAHQPSDRRLGAPAVAWGYHNTLVVQLYGSSSCPTLPSSATRQGATGLRVQTKAYQAPGATACTADLRPWYGTVALPTGLDVSRPVTVIIGGDTIRLPART